MSWWANSSSGSSRAREYPVCPGCQKPGPPDKLVSAEFRSIARGMAMVEVRRAMIATFVATIFVPMLPLLGGEKTSDKIRGRIQEYERARRLLVVYPKNKAPQARNAAREAGFKVVAHERNLDALRCRWDGNDRKTLERMLIELAASPAVRLIEPDPR